MKDFLKFTLATITGIIVSSVLLFILSIGVMFSLLYASDAEVTVPQNAILKLELDGTLAERSQEDPLTLLTGSEQQTTGLDDLLTAIRKAKEHENIKGIYLETTALTANGYAALQAVREALADFRTTGKFVVAYGDTYTQGAYYVASVADRVLLNPQGMMEWTGMASAPLFYKDLTDKLGIRWQIFKVGTYKSATEPYTDNKMSQASREQQTECLGNLWATIKADVAEARNLTTEELDQAAERMMLLQPAEDCVDCGLADTLMYKDDVREYLKQLAGIETDDELHTLSLEEMMNVQKNKPKDKSGNIVAVYYACGLIGGGPAGAGDIEADKVVSDLRRLKEDEDVKAVVLRINSPGGSAYDSEQIWHAVSELKKEKTVIASMGDYAASGGYYIACAADTLVAQPATLTGSIGIFGIIPDAQGLAQKIGIGQDVVKTNGYSDFGNLMRPMTDSEKGADASLRGAGIRPLPEPRGARQGDDQGGGGPSGPRTRMDRRKGQGTGTGGRTGRTGTGRGDGRGQGRTGHLHPYGISGQEKRLAATEGTQPRRLRQGTPTAGGDGTTAPPDRDAGTV